MSRIHISNNLGKVGNKISVAGWKSSSRIYRRYQVKNKGVDKNKVENKTKIHYN